ncbi:phytoene desaturase [Tamaricihabitans halophyticus]|uniref:Phytoene desaturase n=1 Tax=Tamaricihabitans halophyticus TaxID=1262583 RepID=A0A4R2R0C6_9PSEU|nr:phytoene desaturase family protein [Tamaricihabitans halophyticus]TCP55144.1 phytoene desaturase [Tamaricihabitans halophyticus]
MRTVTGRTDHVVVVGAGLSGLSCALHLLGSGRNVTVLERSATPGGRAGSRLLGGHRMDSGATVLTMPELAEEAFAAVGATLSDQVTLERLDPAYRAHFADGSTIAVHTDGAEMEEEIRRASGARDAAGYRALRAWLTELYRVERERFIGANFDSPFQLLCPELLRLTAIGGFGRLGPAIATFLGDERLRRLFSFQALYAGLPPRTALAAYGVIPYMDTIAGVYYPRGGVHRLAEAMADTARNAGATIRFDTSAAWLERHGGRVSAVRANTGERFACDAVVLSTELPTAYRLLGHQPRRPVRMRWAPSAFVLHALSDRAWSPIEHHTLMFGQHWETTFREITTTGQLMTDPSLLVTNPTRTDPQLTGNGKQLYTVLAPCPNTETARIDWDRVGPAYGAELERVLEARGLTGFGDSLEERVRCTPEDWAADGLAAGTPFSAAHTFRQTGPFRPRNLVSGVDNAVLAGCGTTPGVGIPPVLISGKLAAARITGGR